VTREDENKFDSILLINGEQAETERLVVLLLSFTRKCGVPDD
jgi:hypothetical protein